ncbi:hypothetical protein J3459_012551 [Metarhizium acridum]|uniref:uncharacterized protein n=1 Tax=Metarhizium acridum TaxID=92637 RepID=UPI001C6B316D|nr:hypothetical protein J3459_012551 [Metarhizium acridum]KAG8425634.1 hypothetical protein J3458_002316 [Metarhizium acridum]
MEMLGPACGARPNPTAQVGLCCIVPQPTPLTSGVFVHVRFYLDPTPCHSLSPHLVFSPRPAALTFHRGTSSPANSRIHLHRRSVSALGHPSRSPKTSPMSP